MDGEDDLKEELTRRLYSRWNWYFEMTPEQQAKRIKQRIYMKKYYQKKRLKKLMEE